MKTVQISLNSIDKVKSFVNAMGIFSLDLSKPIDLAIHAGDTDMSEIMEALKPYLV